MKKTKQFIFSLIIELFNNSIRPEKVMSFKETNQITTPIGYLVAPEVCCEEIISFVQSKNINYNATFYKKWSSVISKNRFEIFMHQLMHYASTYGTDFQGEPYFPETFTEVPPFTEFKVIGLITEEEVIKRCQEMLYSGIALKQETIENIFYILDYFNAEIDVDQVKNREAKMLLCKIGNILPKNPVEMVRFLVYSAIGKTLLIKDPATIGKIRLSKDAVNINKYINAFGIEKMASVYHRFHPIFLAFKKADSRNKVIINKLSRIADKHHVPMSEGYFEKLLSSANFIEELTHEKLDKISNFKKILLLQTINIRLKKVANPAYIVRNQKLWVKITAATNKVDDGDLIKCFFLIYENLSRNMKKKACKIKLPKNVNLMLPTSEKSFVGNFPLGTSFDFQDNDSIIGIHWTRDEARDIDLSRIDVYGNKYGWNARYTNSDNSVIYSGDVTQPNPEGVEMFYGKNGFNIEPYIVKANIYSGEINPKIKLFLATEKINNLINYKGDPNSREKKLPVDYMVNPNNIIFTIDIEMDSTEKTFGVLANNKFYIANLRTGDSTVSKVDVTTKYMDFVLGTMDCYLKLKDLLVNSGFTIIEDDTTPDVDLTSLSKDTLISLLS